MKPGQAFKFNDGVSLADAKSMASQRAGGYAMKFAVRQTEDGVYCWRIDGTDIEVPNGNYKQRVPVIDNYVEVAAPAAETAVVGYDAMKPEDAI